MSAAPNAAVAVEALTLTLGVFRLEAIDLAVAAGEILVVLGPNGAGKSVTLETIAGFHRPDRGRVLIGGREVTMLPPERRNIGFLVQNFGLFPHLSVEANVAIARRRAAPPRGAASPGGGEPGALLHYFGVAHLKRRLPADLSPGEKQRVALARALAGAPDLFLFDEPFSALDTETRTQLRGELKSFLRALSIPAIFVTHDHADAHTLADRIVVLRQGRMVQTGTAAAVFAQPADAAVARFVGVDNILKGQILEAQIDAQILDGQAAESGSAMVGIAVGPRTLRAAASGVIAAGTPVRLAIRAEEVAIAGAAGGPELNRLDGTVTGLQAQGPLVAVAIDCGFALKAYVLAPQARALGIGDAVTVAIAPDAIHVMQS